MMRVALVQEHIDPRRGGAETSTIEMARHLMACGCDVTLVSAGPIDVDRVVAGSCPARLHAVEVGSGSRTQQTVRFVSAADRFCRMEGFEIVHAITPCLSANVYQPRGGTYKETIHRSIASGRTALGRLSKWFSRRTNRRQRFLLLLEKSLLRSARPPLVAALSEYVRTQVRDGYGVPEARIRVIFNGVDIEPLAPDAAADARIRVREGLGIDGSTPLALFAAHNFALKGLLELIESAATRTGRVTGFRVVVAGRDSESAYRRRARRLQVADRFFFAGSVDDLRPFFAAADVLAHPTWYDPCSRVALEALCCGVPVVTTRFNGAADVLQSGRNGVVVDAPDDAPALAAALATALSEAIRTNCRSDAVALRPRLSMARHARELLKAYHELKQ